MSKNIPEIAIISEPSFDNETISITNDVLTDTEDLFDEQPVERPKSKLKIKIPKDDEDGAVTDVEDFETSDGEGDCEKIVEHNQPIRINDLDFESCTFEELLKSNQDDLGKKKNTQMQTLETPMNLREEIENVLTDYEQFSTDSEIEEDTIPETDANFDDIPENSISISDNYKEKTVQNKFHENLTDCESIVPENSTNSKKSKPRRRRTKHSNKQSYIGKKSLSLPLSPTCNDDSEDDRNHLGFTLCKSVVNSPQEVATDVEEIESGEPIITKPKRRPSIKVVEEPVNLSVNEKQSLSDKQGGDSVIKSSGSETEEESLNEYIEEFKAPDISLPPPTRVLILLQENQSLIPTTKILPLDEHQPEVLKIDESSANQTDIESFKDNDDNVEESEDNKDETPEIVGGAEGTSADCEDNGSAELDAITDNEQVLNKEQTKRNYLITDGEDSSSNRTETENFETDTDENGGNPNYNNKSNNPHTDTEELLGDDEVQNETGTMYLKGGSHLADDSDGDPLIFFNFEEGSVSFGICKDWDVGKKPTTTTESVKEAPTAIPETEQQVRHNNYVTYESVLLKSDCSMPTNPDNPSINPVSYKQIDDMLEKMLNEVEKQEKLFELDLDILETDSTKCINTLELIPDNDALIELPIKKSDLYSNYQEIQINDNHDLIDFENEFNIKEDLLFNNNNIRVASNESLNDDDYEPIEYNPLTCAYQRLDYYQPNREMWFEGTYRNLSIVPEEDEDDNTSLLSDYSTCRTKSLSSNRSSFYRTLPLQSQDVVDTSDDSSDDGDDDGDDNCSSSDLEQGYTKFDSIVKAEVKLLVKTSDEGKEAIEIRSVRKFIETPKITDETLDNSRYHSITNRKRLNRSDSRENLLKDEPKSPSFTLPQLLMKTPENKSNLIEMKPFGSRPELIATPLENFPLNYNPQTAIEVKNVDLYANIPFRPVYRDTTPNQYSLKIISSPQTNPFTETISNPFNDNEEIPAAYCDWFVGDTIGGLSTTIDNIIDSNESVKQPVNGLTIVDNNLIIDLEKVLDQTNAFIQSESQPEPYDNLTDKLTKIDITDRKMDDNKYNTNEKKKAKKGFFGTIKTFVKESFESDSDSEKSSKKPKKEHKKKKSIDEKSPPKKPKLPTPPLEPSDLETIPYVEASPSDLPPPYKPPEVPIESDKISPPLPPIPPATKPVEKKIEESPKKPTKTKSREKSPKQPKIQSIVVEEITKKIEPLVVETEEFSIVVDPTRKESPKKSRETFTLNIDESIEKIEKEILEKSPILPEEKIIKPVAVLDSPTKQAVIKEDFYEDIAEPVVSPSPDQLANIKVTSTSFINNEINFTGWSDDPHNVRKSEPATETVEEEIIEKHDQELSKENAKVDDSTKNKKDDTKKKGLFGLFKKPKKEKEEIITQKLSDATLKDMTDTRQFLTTEVENYHDVRPQVVRVEETAKIIDKPEEKTPKIKSRESSEERGFLGLFKKPKKETEKEEKLETEKPVEVQTETQVTSPKLKSRESSEERVGLLDKLKKSKKDKLDEKDETKLTETVIKDMTDTTQFLSQEIELYHDVKPVVKQTDTQKEAPSVKEVVQTEAESTPKKKLKKVKSRDSSEERGGFFDLFKKSKKETPEAAQEIQRLDDTKPVKEEESVTQKDLQTGSEIILKDITNTQDFLAQEIEKYHDVKPIKSEKLKQEEVAIREIVKPEVDASSAVKRDEPAQVPVTKALVKDTCDTKQVIIKEVIVKESDKSRSETIPEKQHKVVKPEESTEERGGFFDFFKKSKKEKISETTQKSMDETNDFLQQEVKDYHDVKPIIPKIEEQTIKQIVQTEAEKSLEKRPKKVKSDEPTEERVGFFDILKKSKKDIIEETPLPKVSESVQKNIDDTDDFLKQEIERYHDVKPTLSQNEVTEQVINKTVVEAKTGKSPEKKPKKVKSREPSEERGGFFDMFKKTKKDKPEEPPKVSELVQKDIDNTTDFLKQEIDLYHDVMPIKSQIDIKEKFVAEKVDIVKVEKIPEKEPKKVKSRETSEERGGFFDMFKKTKKDKPEEPPKVSELVQKDIDNTTDFLKQEIEFYHDVKPTKPQIEVTEQVVDKKVVEAKTEKSPEKKPKKVKSREPSEERGGFFDIFKKTKKDKPEEPLKVSESVQKDIDNTNDFLKQEIDLYHDVMPIKPQIDIKEEFVAEKVDIVKVEKIPEKEPKKVKSREPSEERGGFFDMFKKTKKDKPEEPPKVSELVQKDIDNTTDFLKQEIEFYHDVKPTKPQIEVTEQVVDKKVVEAKTEKSPEKKPKKVKSREPSEERGGFFDIFKKTKKDKPEEPPKVSESVQKDINNTNDFLKQEIELYHDVRPIKPQIDIKEELVAEKVDIVKVEKIPEKEPKKVKSREPSEERGGFFDMFKKTKKDKPEEPPKVPESVQNDIDNTNGFLKQEIDRYHDPTPAVFSVEVKEEAMDKKVMDIKTEKSPEKKPKKEKSREPSEERSSFFEMFKKTKKDKPEEQLKLSESLQKNIDNTNDFLTQEIEHYHDVKPVISPIEVKEEIIDKKVVETKTEKSPEKKSKKIKSRESSEERTGFFDMFKKIKKDKPEEQLKISESLQKDIDNTNGFLKQEIEHYHDVKPLILPIEVEEEIINRKVVEAKTEKSPEKKPKKIKTRESPEEHSGLFDMFKKTKKDKPEELPKVSESLQKDIDNTNDFLKQEIDHYHDVRPVVLPTEVKEEVIDKKIDVKTEKSPEKKPKKVKSRETSEERSGFFDMFKKSNKDKIEEQPISESLQKDIDNTNDFLKQETERYHDVKSAVLPTEAKEEIIDKKVTETKTEKSPEKKPKKVKLQEPSEERSGFFDIFKKSKKPEEQHKISESLQKDIDNTNNFLKQEMEHYHDVKPVVSQSEIKEEVHQVIAIKIEKTPEVKSKKPKSREPSEERSGLFDIFKKTKKDKHEEQPKMSESLQKDIDNTNDFLKQEIEKYHDVKPAILKSEAKEEIIEKVVDMKTEKSPEMSLKERKLQEPSEERSSSFFDIFKKSKKDKIEPQQIKLSEQVQKDMDNSNDFLKQEIERYHDVRPIITETVTEFTVKEIEQTLENKQIKSTEERGGFFDKLIKPKKDKSKEAQISEAAEKRMLDTNKFLSQEVENYHDVRPFIENIESQTIESKPADLKDLSTVKADTDSSKEEHLKKIKVIETKNQPVSEKKTKKQKSRESSVDRGFFDMFKKSKDKKEISLSETTIKDMNDTTKFLNDEIKYYHDVRATIEKAKEEPKTEIGTKSDKIKTDETAEERASFFGLFKKSKKDKDEITATPTISDSTLKDIHDTNEFLSQEIEKYNDVKEEMPKLAEEHAVEKVKVEDTKTVPKERQRSEERTGILAILKISKKPKDEKPAPVQLSEAVAKSLANTKQFLENEIQYYHDVKPTISEKQVEEKVAEIATPSSKKKLFKSRSREPSEERSGFLGLFKKTAKDDKTDEITKDDATKPEKVIETVECTVEEKIQKTEKGITDSLSPKQEKIVLSEEIMKNITDTNQFLSQEIENYHDVKPVAAPVEIIKKTEIKTKTKEPATEKKSSSEDEKSGFFGLFKKSKKDDVKPESEAKKVIESEAKEVEKKVESPKKSGLLSKFRRSKGPSEFSQEVLQNMIDTKNFIKTEIDNYEHGEYITKLPPLEQVISDQSEKAIVVQDVQEASLQFVKIADTEIKPTEPTTESENVQTSKLEKKSKQDKRGLFGLFGKKKSQDESTETIEGSPKKIKEKRVKLFEKPKKFEDDGTKAPEISQIDDAKVVPEPEFREVKRESGELGSKLSKEVLETLDQKFKELKKPYSEETLKEIQDCRDFLFIEVDNYDDGKPHVVTDIDKNTVELTWGQTVDDLTEIGREDVKKVVDDVLDAATQSIEDNKLKTETIKEKETKTLDEKMIKPKKESEGLLTKIGGIFTSSSKDIGDEIVDQKQRTTEKIEQVEKTTSDVVEEISKETDKISTRLEKSTEKTKEEGNSLEQVVSATVGQTIDSAKPKIDEGTTIIKRVEKQVSVTIKDTMKQPENEKDTISKTIAKEDLEKEINLQMESLRRASQNLTQEAIEDFAKLQEEIGKDTDRVEATLETKVEELIDIKDKEAEKLVEEAAQLEQIKKVTEKKMDDIKKGLADVKINLKEAYEKTTDKSVDVLATGFTELGKVSDSEKKKVSDKIQDQKQELTKQIEDGKMKIDKTVSDLSDSADAKITETEKSAKKAKKGIGGFIAKGLSDIGGVFSGKAKETKEKAKGIENQAETVKSSVVHKIETVKTDIEDHSRAVAENLKDQADKTKQEIKETQEAATEKMKIAKEEIGDKIKDKTKSVKDEIETKIDSTKQDIEDNTKLIKDKIQSTVTTVKGEIKKETKSAKDSISKKIESTKDGLESKIESIKETTTSEMKSLKDKAETTKKEVKDKTTVVGDTIKQAIDSTKDEIKEESQILKDEVKEKVDSTKEELGAKIETAKDETIKTMESVTDKMQTTQEKMKDKLLVAGDEIRASVETTKDDIMKKTESLKNNIQEKIESTKDGLDGKIETIKEATTIEIKSLKDKTETTKEKVLDKIIVAGDTVEHAVDSTKDKLKKESQSLKDEIKQKAESTKEELGHRVESVQKETTKTKESIKDKIETTKDDLREKLKITGDEIKASVETTQDDIKKKTESVKDNVEEKVKSTKKEVGKKVEFVIEGTTSKVDDLKQEVEEKTKSAKTEITAIRDDVKEKVESKTDDIKKQTEAIKEDVGSKVDSVKKDVDKKVEGGFSLLKSFKDKVEDKTESLKESTQDKLTKTEKEVQKGVESVTEDTSAKTQSLKEEVDQAIKLTKQNAAKKIDQTQQFVEEKLIKAKEDINKEVETVEKDLSSTVETVKDNLGSKEAQIASQLKTLKGKISGDAKMVKESIQETPAKVAEDVKSRADSIKKDLSDEVKTKTESIRQTTTGAINTGISSTSGKIAEVSDRFGTAKEEIKESTTKALKEVDGKIISLSDVIKDKAKSTKGTIDGKIDEASDRLVELEEKLEDESESLKKSVHDKLSDTKDTIIGGTESFKSIEESAKGKAIKTEDIIRKQLEAVKDDTVDKTETVKKRLDDKLGEATKEAEDKAKSIEQGVESIGQDIIDKADLIKTEMKSKIVETSDEVDSLKHKVEGKAQSVKEITKKKVGSEQATVQAESDLLKDDITNKTDIVKEDTLKSLEFIKDETAKKVDSLKQGLGDIKIAEGKVEKVTSTKAKEEAKVEQSDTKSKSKEKPEKSAKKSKKGIGGFLAKGLSDIGGALTGKLKEGKDKAKEVTEDMQSKTESVKSTVESKIDDFKTDVKHQIETTKETVKDKIDATKETVKDKIDATVKGVQKGSDEVKSKVEQTKEKAGDKLTSLKKDIKDTAKTTEKQIESTVSSTKDDIQKGAATVTEGIGSVKEEIEDKMKSVKQDTSAELQLLKDKGEAVKEKIDDQLAIADDTIKHTADSVKDDLTKKSQTIAEEIKQKTQDTKEDIEGKINTLRQGSGKKVDSLMEKVDLAADEVKASIESTKDDAKKGFESLKKATETQVELTKEEVGKVAEPIAATTTSKVEALKDTIRDKVEPIKTEIEAKKEAIKEDAKIIKDKLESKTISAKETIDKQVTATSDLLKSFKDKLEDKAAAIKGSTHETITKTEEDIQKGVKSIKEEIATTTASLKDESAKTVDAQITSIHEGLKKGTETVKQDVNEGTKALKEEAKDIRHQTEMIASTGKEELTKLKEDAKQSVGLIQDDVKTKTETFKTDMDLTIASAKDKAQDKITATEDTVEEKLNKTADTIISVQKKIGDKSEALIDAAQEKAVKTAGSIKKKTESVKDETVEKVESLKDKIEDSTKSLKGSTAEKISETAESLQKLAGSTKAKVSEQAKSLKEITQDKIAETKNAVKTGAKSVQAGTIDKTESIKKEIDDKLVEIADKLDSLKDITEDQSKSLKEGVDGTREVVKKEGEAIEDDLKKKIDSTATELEGAVVKLDSLKSKTEDQAKTLKKSVEDKIIKTEDKLKKGVESIKKETVDKIELAKKEIEDNADLSKEKIKDEFKSVEESAQEKVAKTEGIFKKGFESLKSGLFSKGETVKKEAIDTLQTVEDKTKEQVDKTVKSTKEINDKLEKDVQAKVDETKSQLEKVKGGVEAVVEATQKPSFIEISSTKSANEEETEQVTTPKRKPLFHIESEEDDTVDVGIKRRDSVKSNVLETLTEAKVDSLLSDLVQDLAASTVDIKDKPLPSEKVTKVEQELETIKKESTVDVDEIERKLCDLDKALDTLEKETDPKLERKLHRVERKFEHMASQAMEKDIVDKMVSPTEIVDQRETEFQRLVSQLSTEEVSDFQKEYSHLWDETTFSKSDEWDSKTPDSQVDVQELPQGEIVYMAPVTLNKDNSVNKAGIEVEVIPIKRTSCPSPKRKQKRSSRRAKSALDFYNNDDNSSSINEYDRGSLPDLKTKPCKGSLLSTIVQMNPDRFLSTRSLTITEDQRESEPLSKGEIMTAVLDWLNISEMGKSQTSDSCSICSLDSTVSQMSNIERQIPTIVVDKKTKKRNRKKSKKGRGEEAGTSSSGAHREASTSLKAQASRRRQLRYDISIDDQTEVDPREHDWRFNLTKHAEEEIASSSQQQRPEQSRPIADQHQLSEEMKQLLKDLEKESKQ